VNNEEILDNLAILESNPTLGGNADNGGLNGPNNGVKAYTRAELLSAALYGINELHAECVELLAKHSPFGKGRGSVVAGRFGGGVK
jgi:hypothetical protein